MKLIPPFGVRESSGRVLIVPAHSASRMTAIAEALPYGSAEPLELAQAIAAYLNWHPQLVGTLSELCRELAASPRNLTRRQQVTLFHAVQVLKEVQR